MSPIERNLFFFIFWLRAKLRAEKQQQCGRR